MGDTFNLRVSPSQRLDQPPNRRRLQVLAARVCWVCVCVRMCTCVFICLCMYVCLSVCCFVC